MKHDSIDDTRWTLSTEIGSATLRLGPVFIPVVMMLVALGLTGAYLLGKVLKYGCGSEMCLVFAAMTDLNGEANLPAWFSSMSWQIAAALAVMIALARQGGRIPWRGHWLGLGALCLFLSFDEAVMFHENVGGRLGGSIDAGSVLPYNWLAYGLAVVAVVGIVYLPFLRAMPAGTRWRMVAAGAVFLAGAVGVESLGGLSSKGTIGLVVGGPAWVTATAVEEFLEMLGIVGFIHALLHHMSWRERTLLVRIGGAERPEVLPRPRQTAAPFSGRRTAIDRDHVA